MTFVHRSGHDARYLLPEIMGGGAALFDMDDDGDLDVFLVQSGKVGSAPGTPAGHRLYENRGNGDFVDVSDTHGVAALAGYGMGVATADYDNDGDVDVYVTGSRLQRPSAERRPRALSRTSPGRPVSAASGWSTSATFADIDGDTHLDLFVTRYLDWTTDRERECFSLTGRVDYCSPKNYDAPTTDLLFHNNGNGTFTDISRSAGIAAAVGNGLGVIADDVNGDGRVDVFVANDGTPNHLWMNQGDRRFAESALVSGVAIDQDGAPKAGMGVHAADVDDDGDNDLIVMNLDTESDSFYRNEGRFFVDATVAAGLRVASRRFTRFGVAMLDFDNDGRLDLYEANGRVGLQAETFAADPYAEPNLLFRGGSGRTLRGGGAERRDQRSHSSPPAAPRPSATSTTTAASTSSSPIATRRRTCCATSCRTAATGCCCASASALAGTRSGRRCRSMPAAEPSAATCGPATAISPPTTLECTWAWASYDRSVGDRALGGRHERAVRTVRGGPGGGHAAPRRRHATSGGAALKKGRRHRRSDVRSGCLTDEACRVVHDPRTFIERTLRVRTQWPRAIDDAVEQTRGDDPFGRDAVLDPLLQRGLHVERVGARSAAMSHARRHEQPVEALDLSIVLAAIEREHALVVVDAVLRRDELIDPPGAGLNQLAASLLERAEVGIGGVQDRRELLLRLSRAPRSRPDR